MKKLLVIGDLILDRVVRGNVSRLSPNSNAPILCKTNEKVYLGGAGNVYNNIKLLDAKVDIYSVLGADEAGETIKKLINDSSQCNNIIVDSNFMTTVKNRYVTENDQDLLRVDEEKNIEISRSIYSLFRNDILDRVSDYEIVIISDYCKGVLCDVFIRSLIKRCIANGTKIFVDTKRFDINAYKNCCLIKITKKELFTIFSENKNDDIVYYAKTLKKMLECESVIITDAENPLHYIFGDDEVKVFHPEKIRPVDSTGAGDVFIAALAVKILNGNNIFSAISYAMKLCSLVISVSGTSVIDKKHIFDTTYNEGIINRIAECKEDGKRIVFVNGCFDILHMGHIKLFKEAKKAGDILVAGINSDASIRRVKGVSRPINPQEERCALLSTIKYIDYVIVFDEEYPGELIKKVRPHVIYKGSDYEHKQMPEDDIIKEINCKVQYIKKSTAHSTTNIIERLITNK